jgi:hypothetical protein
MILRATDYRFFLGIPVKPENNMKRYLRLDWQWLQVPLGAAAVEGLHAQAKPPVGVALKGC